MMKQGKQKISLDALIYSVESALVNLENLEQEHSANQRSFGYSKANAEDNLQLDEYSKFMDELKTSLHTYANENNKTELVALFDRLYNAAGMDTKSLLNKLQFELKGLQE